MLKFLYKTFILNMFMESTDVYGQQPPKSTYLSALQQKLLKIVSEDINSMMPIDFCLNKTTLDTLYSDEYSPSILEGHEDDTLDEKQSNFEKFLFTFSIYLYFNTASIVRIQHIVVRKIKKVAPEAHYTLFANMTNRGRNYFFTE